MMVGKAGGVKVAKNAPKTLGGKKQPVLLAVRKTAIAKRATPLKGNLAQKLVSRARLSGRPTAPSLLAKKQGLAVVKLGKKKAPAAPKMLLAKPGKQQQANGRGRVLQPVAPKVVQQRVVQSQQVLQSLNERIRLEKQKLAQLERASQLAARQQVGRQPVKQAVRQQPMGDGRKQMGANRNGRNAPKMVMQQQQRAPKMVQGGVRKGGNRGGMRMPIASRLGNQGGRSNQQLKQQNAPRFVQQGGKRQQQQQRNPKRANAPKMLVGGGGQQQRRKGGNNNGAVSMDWETANQYVYAAQGGGRGGRGGGRKQQRGRGRR